MPALLPHSEKDRPLKKYSPALVIAVCSILATAGMVGPGAFRYVLLVCAALIAIVLARKALARNGNQH